MWTHLVFFARIHIFGIEYCYRSFKYPSKLKYHLKKHKKEDLDAICLLEEKDLKWNCSECSHKFLTESLLENHAKFVHRSPMKSHKCDECGEKFESYSILRLHSRRVHKIILKLYNGEMEARN